MTNFHFSRDYFTKISFFRNHLTGNSLFLRSFDENRVFSRSSSLNRVFSFHDSLSKIAFYTTILWRNSRFYRKIFRKDAFFLWHWGKRVFVAILHKFCGVFFPLHNTVAVEFTNCCLNKRFAMFLKSGKSSVAVGCMVKNTIFTSLVAWTRFYSIRALIRICSIEATKITI